MPWSQRNRPGQALPLEVAALSGRQNVTTARSSLIKARPPAPQVGGRTGAAGRLTILFSRPWAEGGYLRLPLPPGGGVPRCGVMREVPVLDGSIVQLNFRGRRAARPRYLSLTRPACCLAICSLMAILTAADFAAYQSPKVASLAFPEAQHGPAWGVGGGQDGGKAAARPVCRDDAIPSAITSDVLFVGC
jgi:hypothetical protein